jgi:hypothetical protein
VISQRQSSAKPILGDTPGFPRFTGPGSYRRAV